MSTTTIQAKTTKFELNFTTTIYKPWTLEFKFQKDLHCRREEGSAQRAGKMISMEPILNTFIMKNMATSMQLAHQIFSGEPRQANGANILFRSAATMRLFEPTNWKFYLAR